MRHYTGRVFRSKRGKKEKKSQDDVLSQRAGHTHYQFFNKKSTLKARKQLEAALAVLLHVKKVKLLYEALYIKWSARSAHMKRSHEALT